MANNEDLVQRIFQDLNLPGVNTNGTQLNTRWITEDIRPAHHNTLAANNRWATTDNMFASADADDGTLGIDRSGLATETPGRSLADIIDERSRTIQRIVEPVLVQDNYESARKRIVEFTNQLFESSAHFLKDANIPCPAAEKAAQISAIERPEEIQLLSVARETVNAALTVPEVADNYEYYKQQSLSILEHYRTLGRDLMRQEQTFKDKLSKYDKLVAQIKSLTDIPGISDTEEMTNLLKSYEAALKVAAERFHFGDEYKQFLQKTREWAFVRDILMLHRVAVADAQAGPTCGVCLEDHVTHALTGCGHTFCASCKSQLGRACPLCRKSITGAIKIFFN